MYLIIGGNGFLGTYIIQRILDNTTETIVATARNIEGLENSERLLWKKCDICNQVEFDCVINSLKNKNDVKVVFLAAYHNPDLVAETPMFAWNVNVTKLSECVNKLRFASKLFYASTDSVYGNSENNYHFKESDELNPVNIYGKNKCAAEAVVRWSGFNVVRFPFLIGASKVPNRPHFYDKIVDSIKQKQTVEMFSDSYRSSLHFKTAADLLVELIELNKTVPPVVNVCGDRDLSKYDIGLMIENKIRKPKENYTDIRGGGGQFNHSFVG